VIGQAARIGVTGEDLAYDAAGPAGRQQVRLSGYERGSEAENEFLAVLS
jgi:hypothetical protein